MNTMKKKFLQALAKMLPEQVFWGAATTSLYWHRKNTCDKLGGDEVSYTELLHLCHLVEETLSSEQWDDYIIYILSEVHTIHTNEYMLHATWQKRVIALAKVKGIEI